MIDTADRTMRSHNHNKNTSTKSRFVALMLVIFAGGLGAHRFYLGRKHSACSVVLLWAMVAVLMIYQSIQVIIAWHHQPDMNPFLSLNYKIILFSMFCYLVAKVWQWIDLLKIAMGRCIDVSGMVVSQWSESDTPGGYGLHQISPLSAMSR